MYCINFCIRHLHKHFFNFDILYHICIWTFDNLELCVWIVKSNSVLLTPHLFHNQSRMKFKYIFFYSKLHTKNHHNICRLHLNFIHFTLTLCECIVSEKVSLEALIRFVLQQTESRQDVLWGLLRSASNRSKYIGRDFYKVCNFFTFGLRRYEQWYLTLNCYIMVQQFFEQESGPRTPTTHLHNNTAVCLYKAFYV